jgi:heat shock protein HtpX
MHNHLRTFILLAALTALFMGVGYAIAGPGGMALAFLVAAGMNLVSYWNADRIVLSMCGARPVDESDPDPAVRAYVADVPGRGSISSTRSSRTPSPPAATRPMRRSPPRAASSSCSTGARCAACSGTS